jgi:hypothetical protein
VKLHLGLAVEGFVSLGPEHLEFYRHGDLNLSYPVKHIFDG